MHRHPGVLPPVDSRASEKQGDQISRNASQQDWQAGAAQHRSRQLSNEAHLPERIFVAVSRTRGSGSDCAIDAASCDASFLS